MYVLLENSITFEAKLIEHEVDYYVDYEGQPSLHNEGARYFLLEKDRVLIDQIVITNEIGSANETINSFLSKNALGQSLYLKAVFIVVVLTILIVLMIKWEYLTGDKSPEIQF